MENRIRPSGWLFTVTLFATPYLAIWLFLLFIMRPSEQPWLTTAIVWLLMVKAAFVLIIVRHLRIPEGARALPSRQITGLGIGFILAAVVFGCSVLAGEGTVSIVGVLYVFLGVVFLLMAQAAKVRPSNSTTAGDGSGEPAHGNR